jgi:SAM-dependent methyltransferase
MSSWDNNDVYWGEITQSEMRTVNQMARERGWQQALETWVRPRHPDIYSYVTNPVRSQWRFLVPLKPDSQILDIGAGWGPLSFQLAEAGHQVVPLELIAERVEFIRIRCSQSGDQRVRPVRGDALRLPFAPASFDMVVMNGILEWVGCFDSNGDPRQVQLRTLKRIRELLKPGGCLYVGIENRIGYNAFLGSKDHCGLRFTSLMPRVLADFYVRTRSRLASGRRPGHRSAVTAQGYRAYTYSYHGYRRLLAEAGFQLPTVYMALPGYNNPLYLVDADDPASFRYLMQTSLHPRRRITRLLQWLAVETYFLNLPKYFAPAFCIFAER